MKTGIRSDDDIMRKLDVFAPGDRHELIFRNAQLAQDADGFSVADDAGASLLCYDLCTWNYSELMYELFEISLEVVSKAAR